MGDIIDYNTIRTAVGHATSDIKSDVNRISSAVQALTQDISRHTGMLNTMHTQSQAMSGTQQQLNTMHDQITSLTAKVDQLTNQMQNLMARLP